MAFRRFGHNIVPSAAKATTTVEFGFDGVKVHKIRPGPLYMQGPGDT